MNDVTQFGPYTLLERISVGGMAEVFKAKEFGVEGFERIVAVKRILPHVAEDEEFIAMFKDEAKIAVQLQHPNIAQIFNLGQEGDSFYIALEYIDGRDVRAIFQRCEQQGRRMPVAQACFVIMQVCEGLDYAHQKKDKFGRPLNIVHRDVSPPNVLVSFEGEVKLIDFGVAKAAGRASKTQAGILKGKFGYMSPEQVRGMPLDKRSDVFSVGVVLWEVLTNRRLFQGETDFATLEMVRAVEVPKPSAINPEIPAALEAIVYKALAREPDERYQSAMELHDDLQAFMFANGMFYSRKELGAWMAENYAKELEQAKAKAGPPLPPGARRPTAPPSPPTPARGATAAPRPPVPPTQAHRVVGGPPQPPASASGSGRIRGKTLMMSPSSPNLPLPAGPAARPAPPPPAAPAPRPKPTASPAAAAGGGGGGDLDWDDDELETRLYDGETGPDGKPVAPAAAQARPVVTPAPAATPGRGLPAAPTQPPRPSAGASPGLPAPPSQPLPAAPAASPFGAAPATSMAGRPLASTSLSATPAGGSPALSTVATVVEPEPTDNRTMLVLIAAVAAALLLVGGAWVVFFRPAAAPATVATGSDAGPTGTAQAGVAPAADGAALASLTVEATPPDAEVLVDGVAIKGPSPFVATGLAAGKHKLVVRKDDAYQAFERELELTAGTPLVLPVTLTLAKVSLDLTGITPAGASVALITNGGAPAPLGSAGGTVAVALTTGATYQLQVSAPGHVTQTIPLALGAAATQPVALALPAAAPAVADARPTGSRTGGTKRPTGGGGGGGGGGSKAKTAVLKIGTMPGVPPANVTVDGANAGKTPIGSLAVAPGKHTVKCTWPDGKSSTQTVTVADGPPQIVRCAK